MPGGVTESATLDRLLSRWRQGAVELLPASLVMSRVDHHGVAGHLSTPLSGRDDLPDGLSG
jgi:hypothetical protein